MLALVFAIATGHNIANAGYVVTDLGAGLTPVAINDKGQVVGRDLAGNGFIWVGGQLTSIPPSIPGLGSYSFAPTDINNAGIVVGNVIYEGGRAYAWASGQYQELQGSSNPSTPYSSVVKINNVNQSVGTIRMPAYVGGGVDRATTWDGNYFNTDLQWVTLAGTYPNAQWSNSSGTGINDFGFVVGISQASSGESRPFIFANGHISELTATGTDISGTRPLAINNVGTIVGENLNGLGFILRGGAAISLGFAGGTFSIPRGINDLDTVVGMATFGDATQSAHAFVYADGDMVALDSLSEVMDAGWGQITYANDINNSGQIIGVGILNGEYHAFLMTPVPEPSSAILALSGLVIVFGANRRRVMRF